ncbi:MAG: TldD/PmbA family protein, partial [Microcystis sp. M53599_WE4]|nr:TldD/PmbA family protein [Microcystis sp. M53599_WE4]
MPKVEDIAQIANSSAQALGIAKYDIYGSSVDETDVDVFQGEPKQVQASNRSSVIVRVWNRDNQVGVTSTTDVDPVGLQLALKTAQEASFFGVKENVPDFSPAATAPTTEVASEMSNQAPVSTLVDKLLAAEKSLLAAHPAIASVPYNGLGQQQVRRFYLNSDGAMRQEARSYASVYLYTKTEQEGKKPRSAGAFRVSPGLEKLDIDGCIEEA